MSINPDDNKYYDFEQLDFNYYNIFYMFII